MAADHPSKSSDEHAHPVPPEALGLYTVDQDPPTQLDIRSYVEVQAPGESVLHAERIKREVVIGDSYDIWDVTTDQGRWWVITNLTNLYSQAHFPSLDYTLSFHIGLMMRLKSRETGADSGDPTPFEDVLRRLDQAGERHQGALEAEDYQAVGMQLRECLISLVSALRRRIDVDDGAEPPKDADVIGWCELLFNQLLPGKGNKELRAHLKGTAKTTWQLVSWLTHHRRANKAASLIAVESCHTLVGHTMVLLQRDRGDAMEQCPICGSRQVRSHFDAAIGSDGDYYLSCASCRWDSHPDGIDA